MTEYGYSRFSPKENLTTMRESDYNYQDVSASVGDIKKMININNSNIGIILTGETANVPLLDATLTNTNYKNLYTLPLLEKGLYIIEATYIITPSGGTCATQRFEITDNILMPLGFSFNYNTSAIVQSTYYNIQLIIQVDIKQTIPLKLMVGAHYGTCTSINGRCKYKITQLK